MKKNIVLPLYTLFIEHSKNINRPSTVHSFKGPFEFSHEDIAEIWLAAKPALDPKYFVLVVDLFTTKIYT